MCDRNETNKSHYDILELLCLEKNK